LKSFNIIRDYLFCGIIKHIHDKNKMATYLSFTYFTISIYLYQVFQQFFSATAELGGIIYFKHVLDVSESEFPGCCQKLYNIKTENDIMNGNLIKVN